MKPSSYPEYRIVCKDAYILEVVELLGAGLPEGTELLSYISQGFDYKNDAEEASDAIALQIEFNYGGNLTKRAYRHAAKSSYEDYVSSASKQDDIVDTEFLTE